MWRLAMLLYLISALACAGEPANVGELAAQRKAAREHLAQAQRLIKAAHAALDKADYDNAVAQHKRAIELRNTAAELGRKLDAVFEAAIAAVIQDLKSDDFNARELASANLLKLGARAVPALKRLAKNDDPEVAARLTAAVARLELLQEDDEGRVRQWAKTATASSEYNNPNWSALQATGKPDTTAAGDATTAWAAFNADGGDEWLELAYEQDVRVTTVRILENFNPGAVTKIEAKDEKGAWQTLWKGKDTTATAMQWFEVKIEPPAWATCVIRITIDNSIPGWNEIDAVELIGEPEE